MLKGYQFFNLIALLLLIAAIACHYVFPEEQLWSTLLIVFAVFCHSLRVWGIFNTILYLVLAVVIGFFVEFIGISTGWIFGHYHYNPVDQNMLLGVPLFIPLLYFPFLYAGNFMTVAIARRSLEKRSLIFLSLMTGAILMLKDVVTDPLQSTVSNLWVWDKSGEYFGVPVHNFMGWFVVFAVMTFVILELTWHRRNRSAKVPITRSLLIFPIFLFFSFALFGFTEAFLAPEQYREVGNVSAFAAVFYLGPYILLAIFNGFKSPKKPSEHPGGKEG